MRFLFDEMLGRAASWCRIFGLDVELLPGRSDSELLARAKSGGFFLVTRDAGLAKRCGKQGVRCVFVSSGSREEQIAQVVRESGAVMPFPAGIRCPECNGLLEGGSGKGVPDDVLSRGFKRCAECGKPYWEGSHWRNILRIHGKVKRLLE